MAAETAASEARQEAAREKRRRMGRGWGEEAIGGRWEDGKEGLGRRC